MLSVEQIKALIKSGNTWRFYHDKTWVKLSKRVRNEQHNECYYCRRRGKYSPARLVHHIYHIEEYPEHAYKRYYTDANGVPHINLVAVCHNCHEEQHGRGIYAKRKHFTNVERW